MNTINNDAREFGLHVKQGGWRLGLLVARNVEKGAGQAERGSRRNDRSDEKVSATKFAELAGTSHPRVSRYLDAWNRAAEEGHVPAADTLTPGEEVELDVDVLPAWGEFYDARKPETPPPATSVVATRQPRVDVRGLTNRPDPPHVAPVAPYDTTPVDKMIEERAALLKSQGITREPTDSFLVGHLDSASRVYEVSKATKAAQESLVQVSNLVVGAALDDNDRELFVSMVEVVIEEAQMLLEQLKNPLNVEDFLK